MTSNGNPAQARDVGINAYIYLYPAGHHGYHPEAGHQHRAW
jgi:hypothetical protein